MKMSDIRRAEIRDAEGLHELFVSLPPSSPYILRSPNEPQVTLSQRKEWLEATLSQEKSLLLVATVHEKIVGVLLCERRLNRKTRHRGNLSISVSAENRGYRIGHQLMSGLESWLKTQADLLKIEASVMTENSACLKLLDRYGFRLEAQIRNAFLLDDGRFCDETLLAKAIIDDKEVR